MESNQLATIRKSLLVARQIQETNPEIRDRYASGESLAQIAEYLRANNYENPFLEKSISYAIRGHEGGFHVESFMGLITDKNQLKEFAREHNVESGRQLYEARKGVHGVPMELRREYSRKAGQVAAQKSRNGEVKLGSAALPLEDRIKISKCAVRARGQTPWDDMYSEELDLSAEEYALQLSQNPEYIFHTGGNKGKIMWKAIAEELSNEFSHKFSRHSVYCRLVGNKK